MHKRRSILEDIRAQLNALSYFSGVWIQRISPARVQYPSIMLFADSETVSTESIHGMPRPQDRTLSVSVIARIRGAIDDEKAESDMDAAAETVEKAITLPAGANNIVLTATDFTIDETDPEIHEVRLTYQIGYYTDENAPSV